MKLSPETELCRFIVDKGQFLRKPPEPKLSVFMPRVGTGETEPALSTFDVDNLSVDDIWKLGQVEVGNRRGRRIKAKAHFRVEHVNKLSLSAKRDNIPPRHVNVESWPLQKARQISIAQQLAAVVIESGTFSIRPEQ